MTMSENNMDSVAKEASLKEPTKREIQEEEEEDSSEDEELIGELEKPTIVEGKRERKSISRLSLGEEPATQKEELDFSKGKGVKLAEIQRVKYEIERINADQLKPLHRIIYNRGGKQHEIKKNIRSFCGLPFEKDTKAYASTEARVEKFTLEYCKVLCSLFALQTTGKAAELKERILDFLLKPYDAGKGLPTPKGKGSKKKSSQTKKRKPKTGGSKSGSKERESSPVPDDSSDEESASDEESSSPKKKPIEREEASAKDDSDASSVPDEKPPKKAKKEKASKTPKKEVEKKTKDKGVSRETSKKDKKAGTKPKSKAKVTPVKIQKKEKSEAKKKKEATPLKSQKKEPKRKKKDEDSDSDDEPIAKKIKPTMPSNDEIAKIVKEILDGADLETITMKTVCKQVYDRYPGVDLTAKKGFIKETVKKIIS